MLPTRILLVSRQALFRDSLQHLIESQFRFCAVETADCQPLVFGTPHLRHDLVVLDRAIPDFPSPDILRAMAATFALVVLCDDQTDCEALQRLGLWRVINKRLGAGQFLDAVRAIVTRQSTGSDLSEVSQYGLTARERQILAEVACALANKEIAQRLSITEATVKRHLSSVFSKLGLTNRLELTLFAVRHGLLHGSARSEQPRALALASHSLHRAALRRLTAR